MFNNNVAIFVLVAYSLLEEAACRLGIDDPMNDAVGFYPCPSFNQDDRNLLELMSDIQDDARDEEEYDENGFPLFV